MTALEGTIMKLDSFKRYIVNSTDYPEIWMFVMVKERAIYINMAAWEHKLIRVFH